MNVGDKVPKIHLLQIVTAGGLVSLVLFALCSFALAQQKCTRNNTGDWTLRQTNGIKVKLSLTQKGQNLTGRASFQDMKLGRRHIQSGDVTGKLTLEESIRYYFRVEIWWDYGETGVYTGTIDQTNGILGGDAYILQDPRNKGRQTNWKIMQEIPCQ